MEEPEEVIKIPVLRPTLPLPFATEKACYNGSTKKG